MPKLDEKMTNAGVQSVKAPPPGKRIDYLDPRQRALVLRVSGPSKTHPKGSRVWTALFRVKGSKKLRRFTIGAYPSFSLDEARTEAADIIKKAGRGVDPKRERDETDKAKNERAKDTIDAIVTKYVAALAKRPKPRGGMRSARHVAETRKNFVRHVMPRWRDRIISDISRRDVADLLAAVADEGTVVKGEDGQKRQLAGGPIAANRVLAAVRAMFNWALRQGIIEANPATLVERPGEEKARERVLSGDELRALWPQFCSLGYPFSTFFRLALVTGQRRQEVASMRWSDIDEKSAVWSIPKEKTKAQRSHVVPLSTLALSILSEAKAKRLGPHVFSTSGDRPISGFSKAKLRLDDAMPLEENWTIHDLRRSCATGMAALGIDRFLIGRVLNHIDRSITGVYDRHAYLDEKRVALDRWSTHLSKLVEPKVVRLSKCAGR
jgi:integrase